MPPETDPDASANRAPPAYTAAEMCALRIYHMYLREDYLFCLLSDGNTLCVPLEISPVIHRAPLSERRYWRITEQGHALAWHGGSLNEKLSLESMLAHSGALVWRMGGVQQ